MKAVGTNADSERQGSWLKQWGPCQSGGSSPGSGLSAAPGGMGTTALRHGMACRSKSLSCRTKAGGKCLTCGNTRSSCFIQALKYKTIAWNCY